MHENTNSCEDLLTNRLRVIIDHVHDFANITSATPTMIIENVRFFINVLKFRRTMLFCDLIHHIHRHSLITVPRYAT